MVAQILALPSLNLRGWPYSHSLWDSSIPLPLCNSAVRIGCLPFLPCTPGWVGDRRRCWLGGTLRKQWEEDPDFLSLTLKLICYCSAALFILPRAWLELQWLHFFLKVLICCNLFNHEEVRPEPCGVLSCALAVFGGGWRTVRPRILGHAQHWT